jgi:hypothetical protein
MKKVGFKHFFALVLAALIIQACAKQDHDFKNRKANATNGQNNTGNNKPGTPGSGNNQNPPANGSGSGTNTGNTGTTGTGTGTTNTTTPKADGTTPAADNTKKADTTKEDGKADLQTGADKCDNPIHMDIVDGEEKEVSVKDILTGKKGSYKLTNVIHFYDMQTAKDKKAQVVAYGDPLEASTSDQKNKNTISCFSPKNGVFKTSALQAPYSFSTEDGKFEQVRSDVINITDKGTESTTSTIKKSSDLKTMIEEWQSQNWNLVIVELGNKDIMIRVQKTATQEKTGFKASDIMAATYTPVEAAADKKDDAKDSK